MWDRTKSRECPAFHKRCDGCGAKQEANTVMFRRSGGFYCAECRDKLKG